MKDALPFTDSPLDLTGETPVFTGQQQDVYGWPGRPDLLVKVVRPGFAEAHWTGLRGALKRRRRLGIMASAQRALTEQLVLMNAGLPAGRHIQEAVGLVMTTAGPGLVVRAVHGADGRYAPTLRSLLDTGQWSSHLQERLDEFLDWLIASPVVVGDLHAGNVVLAADQANGERLVMIDGMGDKGFVPLNSLSPFFNRRHKLRRAQRLRAAVARIAARAADRPA